MKSPVSPTLPTLDRNPSHSMEKPQHFMSCHPVLDYGLITSVDVLWTEGDIMKYPWFQLVSNVFLLYIYIYIWHAYWHSDIPCNRHNIMYTGWFVDLLNYYGSYMMGCNQYTLFEFHTRPVKRQYTVHIPILRNPIIHRGSIHKIRL